MKKLILGACALSFAATVLAQGTVTFNNRVTGTVVTHVYNFDPANPSAYHAGYGSGDLGPNGPGTDTWVGAALAGSGFSAQLYAAPGLNQPEASLVAASPVTSFRTGAAAGFVASTTATLAGVAADAPNATLVLRVWDNNGGTIATWEAAQTGGKAFGESPLFNVNAIGGTLNTPPNLVGLQSFNLTSTVPEPSTFALAGLGAAALLLFRRRK
jgi:hypothetical protein